MGLESGRKRTSESPDLLQTEGALELQHQAGGSVCSQASHGATLAGSDCWQEIRDLDLLSTYSCLLPVWGRGNYTWIHYQVWVRAQPSGKFSPRVLELV